MKIARELKIVLVALVLFGIFSQTVFAENFLIRNESNQFPFFSIDGDNGNVGVWMSGADEKLEVNGNINVTAGNDICISGGSCLSNVLAFPSCSGGEILVFNETSGEWQCGETGDNIAVGAVQAFSTDTCPEYWLEADGSSLSTTGTYGDLYLAIGTTYGSGAGTFNLPDYRGYFLRGWDNGAGVDPDAGSRTNAGGGGTGDNIGTKQGDATGLPNNPFTTDDPGNHAHNSASRSTSSSVGVNVGGSNTGAGAAGSATNANGAHDHNVTGGGDNETRPQNINVLYCIRAIHKHSSFDEVAGSNYTMTSDTGIITMRLGTN